MEEREGREREKDRDTARERVEEREGRERGRARESEGTIMQL